MGTFTDYTGMTDVPENQCAKYARQMPGLLHTDGMMSADFGGGKVTVRCCYGTIEADKENATYYKGNMASSGLEIRINGRCIERGLYSKVFGKALLPSCNRFLAQIDPAAKSCNSLPSAKVKHLLHNGFRRTARSICLFLNDSIRENRSDMGKLTA